MIPFAASPELQQLKASVQEQLARSSPEVRDWCTAETLQRYLAARKGNVARAAAMLSASLKWREEYQPHRIEWSEIAYNASTGRIELLHETDSLGRQDSTSLHGAGAVDSRVLIWPKLNQHAIDLQAYCGYALEKPDGCKR